MSHKLLTEDATFTKAAYMATLMENEQHAMAAMAHATTDYDKAFWSVRVRFNRRMKIILDSLS